MELERKDKIKKTHEGYVHTIEVRYPHANVQNMRKGWRERIEEGGVWLENFEKNKQEQYDAGIAKLDDDEEKVKKEIEELRSLTEAELLQKLKERNEAYIKRQEEFLAARKEKEELLKAEIDKQMERIKKQLYEDVKEKRDALKLWNSVN